MIKCPVCPVHLKPYNYHGLIVGACLRCGGMWFNPGELLPSLEAFARDNYRFPDPNFPLDKPNIVRNETSEAEKVCPIMGHGPMRSFTYGPESNVQLDRCASCGRIWADGGEVFWIATHRVGNVQWQALGAAIAKQGQSVDQWKDVAEVAGTLSERIERIRISDLLGWYRIKIIQGAALFMNAVFSSRFGGRTLIFPGVVLGVIIANAIVFLYQWSFVKPDSFFYDRYGLIPSQILFGKISFGSGYFSFFSSLFLHGGIVHLIGNMFCLLMFGDKVEEELGHWRFSLFYLLCGLAANLTHILIYPYSDLPVIGASGAIAGVLGAYFVLYPHDRIETPFFDRVIYLPAWFPLGGWFLFQLLYALFGGPDTGIAWSSHIGGFLLGAIWMRFHKKPWVPERLT